MGWYGDHIESQLVISSGAATCAMEAISKSTVGKVHLNKKTFAELLRADVNTFNLTTTSIAH
jgi:hypothetical protein